MKIVSPSATLLSVTPDAEQLIERAGRTCYKSEDRITDDSAGRFVQRLIKLGHESVLEHASATVIIVCDRGVTHELVRHRIASYSQESTRYCRYGDEITVIEPPELSPLARSRWIDAVHHAEWAYRELLAENRPEIARSVLPNCLKTEIVTTANFREWRHICRLRLNPKAHPQMRQVMEMVYRLLVAVAPNVFTDIGDAIWPKPQPVEYGCYCDIETLEVPEPDDCVLDSNNVQDCVYAQQLQREGKGKTHCEWWKPKGVKP